VQALDHLASQPLPATKQVFPWLHGLHADNQLQLAFFIARKKSLRRTPKCIRSITIVKAGGDLSHSKLKGAVAPEEVLQCLKGGKDKDDGDFLDSDPREGFSVRNFQIQACKMATVSDIVVYGDDETPRSEVERLARRMSKAQAAWQRRIEGPNASERPFNTFVVTGELHTVPNHGMRY
jgi:dual specificity MAP kinase phosphatase